MLTAYCMYRFSPEVTTGSPSSQQATAWQPVWCWYMVGGTARGHLEGTGRVSSVAEVCTHLSSYSCKLDNIYTQ